MFFCFSYAFPILAPGAASFPRPVAGHFRKAGEGEHLHRSSRAGQRACFRAFCQGDGRWRPCSLAPERWLKTTFPPSGARLRRQRGDFVRRVFCFGARRFSCPPGPEVCSCAEYCLETQTWHMYMSEFGSPYLGARREGPRRPRTAELPRLHRPFPLSPAPGQSPHSPRTVPAQSPHSPRWKFTQSPLFMDL